MIATPTILSGASESDAIQLDFETPLAIRVPAAWTAASLSFLGSFDGVAYGRITFEGAETAYPVAAGDYLVLDPAKFARVPFLKLRSGTAATPVNQGADRTFVMISSPRAI